MADPSGPEPSSAGRRPGLGDGGPVAHLGAGGVLSAGREGPLGSPGRAEPAGRSGDVTSALSARQEAGCRGSDGDSSQRGESARRGGSCRMAVAEQPARGKLRRGLRESAMVSVSLADRGVLPHLEERVQGRATAVAEP